MSNSDILMQLKGILSPESFVKEPETSLSELINFEEKYNLNTTDFIMKKFKDGFVEINDVFDWVNSYENYLFFDGDITQINSAHTSIHSTIDFLSEQDDKFKLTPEYIVKTEEVDSFIEESTSSVLFYSSNNLVDF